jgi:glycosyltransferase involved in cell wall biosynthesis
MQAAYVTTHDSSDVHSWSGTVFNMVGALRESGLDVETIDTLHDPYGLLFKAKRIFKNIVLKKNYLRDREPLTLRSYAKQVESRLKRLKPDIVFSPGTIPIAYLQTDKPIIFWTDATFDGMLNFYPEFTNLCNETIEDSRRMEQAALSNCRLAIYSSEWAAKTAISNYDVDSRKIKVVPFGANLTRIPTADEIQQAIASRGSGVCKLLFVGVDWNRKGGEMALSVTYMLNERGLDTELHIVGCEPPSPFPPFVKRYGYLSKANHQQSELLHKLYKMSDFFILPSKAECAAVVIAEASAYGLPALTTNVGGLGTVVTDGINGRTFDPLSFCQECTDYIVETLSSKERYHQLCLSSIKEYANRLNWRSAGQSVLKLIGPVLPSRSCL